MIYLQLFLSFLQIGAFSFGGGYAAMPLIQNQVVQLHPWLSQSEFTDLITISQMTPGPIAVNSASFVVTRIAGVAGALKGILKSLRPAVIAMIAAAGVSILVTAFWGNDISSLHLDAILSSTNIRAVGIFLLSLILLARFKMDPIHVMLLSGGAEVVMQLIMKLL